MLANRKDVNEVSPWIYGLSSTGAVMPQYPANLAGAIKADMTSLRAAHMRLVPSIANITGGKWDYQAVSRILHNPALARQQIDSIVGLVQREKYAGIDIDYEELHAGDRQPFDQFVSQLAAALHAHGKVLSVAVFATAAEPVQQRREHGPGLCGHRQGRRPGPDHGLQLPLGELGRRRHRARELGQVSGQVRDRQMPASKVVLGIPLYGYDWPDGKAAAQTVSWLQALRLSRQHAVPARYDKTSQAPHFAYAAGGKTHTVWFENAESSRAKFEVVQGAGIAGVYLWMYGYEDPSTWSALHTTLPVSGPGASSTSKAVP